MAMEGWMIFEQDWEDLLKEIDFTELQQSLIEDCHFCGNKLTFRHKVNFKILRVNEEAYCRDCNIRFKTKEHYLQ